MKITDEVFSLDIDEQFLDIFKLLESVGWEEFLNRLKTREALKIAAATNENERHAIQVRVLLIDELSNFSKSLFSIDTDK